MGSARVAVLDVEGGGGVLLAAHKAQGTHTAQWCGIAMTGAIGIAGFSGGVAQPAMPSATQLMRKDLKIIGAVIERCGLSRQKVL